MNKDRAALINAFVDGQAEMTLHPLRQSFVPQQTVLPMLVEDLLPFRKRHPDQYRKILTILRGVGISGLG